MGAHQHDIHAEGLVCQPARGFNLLPQIIAARVHGGNDAETAAIGNSRRQPPIGNPRHTALENGVLYPQHRADR